MIQFRIDYDVEDIHTEAPISQGTVFAPLDCSNVRAAMDWFLDKVEDQSDRYEFHPIVAMLEF